MALIGANGHGQTHRRHLMSLQDTDTVRLVALADVRPIEPDPSGEQQPAELPGGAVG